MLLKLKKQEEESELNLYDAFALAGALQKEEKIRLVKKLIDDLSGQKQEASEIEIPVGIFDNSVLGSLEAIVKFLHENHGIKFSKIALMLNRSQKTIWATYYKASQKLQKKFSNLSQKIMIPVSIFANR